MNYLEYIVKYLFEASIFLVLSIIVIIIYEKIFNKKKK